MIKILTEEARKYKSKYGFYPKKLFVNRIEAITFIKEFGYKETDKQYQGWLNNGKEHSEMYIMFFDNAVPIRVDILVKK